MMESKSSKIFPIVLSVVAAIISGWFTAHFQTDSLNEELSILKDRNKILQKDFEDQQKQTIIMNQTLATMQQSLEKESLISVKILPYTSDSIISSGVTITYGPGAQYVRKVTPTESYITMKYNLTYDFDIVITNIGEDTAVINNYSMETIQSTERGSFWRGESSDIKKILKPHDEPLIITQKLNVTEKHFPSEGTLYFTVVYDNGISEASGIHYYIDK